MTEPVVDPDESIEGWIPTEDGAVVVNEPQGSPGWYPANDTPKDKATYDFAVTVPEGRAVLANGTLAGKFTRRGRTTWIWRERDPMSPYLSTATNGTFETDFGRLPDGTPIYNAVDPLTRRSGQMNPEPELAWERLAPQPEIIEFFTELYGPYPFRAAGGIIDYAPEVGYALESQTKANYHGWPDIWLNEGFATWSQWIDDERHGGPSAQESFDELYALPPDDGFWSPAPAALEGPAQLFDAAVSDRGAMTLQALRGKVGEETFFSILRAWYAENRFGNVSTADFVVLCERESWQQLGDFFETWLYTPGRPDSW